MPVKSTNSFDEVLMSGLQTWIPKLKVAMGADIEWVNNELEPLVLKKYLEVSGVSQQQASSLAKELSQLQMQQMAGVSPETAVPGVSPMLPADLLSAAMEPNLVQTLGAPPPEPAMPEDEFVRQIAG